MKIKNGNLTSKTDARQVVTNYTYDNLNRVLTRNYSAPQNLANYQAGLNVTYTYDDTNVANSKGKLTKVTNGFSTSEYTEFDILGRVKKSKQMTDGTAYNEMLYTYNLSGALIEETYPSGRVVKNTLDNDGDLQQVQSRKANDTFRNYANSFNYTAAGAVASMRLGNGKWETTSFNSRLQPTQIGLGSSATNQGLLKLNYDYGISDNNGNVKNQQITVPTVGANAGFTAIQTYTYDSLNRLKDAKEMIGTTQTWKQTFTFDRYGNRNFDTTNNNTTTIPAGCAVAVCNPTIDPTTNRLNGYGYDTAGNTTTDTENRSFTYDAENKQTQVKGANNVVIGQYYYDGDGKRVKKFIYNTQETTIFVYDASSKLVAEYSTTVAPVAEAKVSYLTTDHLGSPRITTDANGQVISRRDFMPFGEEVFTTQRTQGLGYTADTIRQKFTSYERDNESELDFAQNRYYNPKHGRFTTADEPFNDQFESNPQSWNLYPYARNNPLNLTDPLGMAADCPPGFPDCIERDGKYFFNDPEEGEIEIDTTSPDPFTDTREKDNKSNSPNTGVVVGFLSPLLEPGVKSPSLLRGSSARLITSPIGIYLLLGTIGIQDLYENGAPCFLCSAQGLRPGERIPGSAIRDRISGNYIPPPRTLPAFPGARRVNRRSQRVRWVDDDGFIYEWDYQHGRVEKYDRRGRHIGEFDPTTGEQTKPANPSRRIDP